MFAICHYHEIALKGRNRSFFEKVLVENIKKSLKKDDFEFVKRISGRIIVKLSSSGAKNRKKIEKSLENVFGLAYFAFAQECGQNIDAISKKALEILKDRKFTTFRIETRRSKKEFPLDSQEINEKVGAFVVDEMKKKVKLVSPSLTLFVEIVEKYAFLYTDKIKGPGGLPLGVGGRAVSLISGGIDSPVASYLAMKRGVRNIFVHFHARPYTDKASIEKVRKLVVVLNKFQFSSKLYLVPFAGIQKQIMLKTPAKLRVIMYRRFMLRIAERIAKKEKALALVTGDSIGQVASQTLENMTAIAQAVKIPVLRPLVGFDKQEIIEKAQDIGTYEISIMPHQDCCARFLPSRVETRADLKEVKVAEKSLNVLQLIRETLSLSEAVKI